MSGHVGQSRKVVPGAVRAVAGSTAAAGSFEATGAAAAIFVSGSNERELSRAMSHVREPERRGRLIEGGRQWAAQHDWAPMVQALRELMHRAWDEGKTEEMTEFFAEWRRLRTIQAEVDIWYPQ